MDREWPLVVIHVLNKYQDEINQEPLHAWLFSKLCTQASFIQLRSESRWRNVER